MTDSSMVGATFTVAHQRRFNPDIVYYLQQGFANTGRGKPCPYEIHKMNTTRCVMCE